MTTDGTYDLEFSFATKEIIGTIGDIWIRSVKYCVNVISLLSWHYCNYSWMSLLLRSINWGI